MSRLIISLGARLVAATASVDRVYRLFDRLRSRAVLALGTDGFFGWYNDFCYGRTALYRADSPAFRRGLFDWERAAISRFFPSPPATVLVGGVGGGREAFGLAELGYLVAAFDPSRRLVSSMREQLGALHGAIEIFEGGFEDLPRLGPAGRAGVPTDLRARARFDAAVLGWASFSHLRHDRGRVEALRGMASLTHGPILVSYFGRTEAEAGSETGPAGSVQSRSGKHGPGANFSVQVGFYRALAEPEVRRVVAEAGLEVVAIDATTNWPHAIVRKVPG